MAINRVNAFQAEEEDLVIYNGDAILDLAIEYVTLDEFDEETDFTFPGYVSSFLNIYDSAERNNLIKAWTSQVSRNSNVQVINASVLDCTFDENQILYYELGYVRSGYDQTLRYGKAIIK